jgi:hypothetical protein
VYEYITELVAWATGISIVALIGIRQVTLRTNKRSRFAGSGNGKAYYVEATILLIVFCVIALRGLEGALSDYTSWNRHFITTWFIAAMFKSMTLTQLENWVQIVATIKIVGSMAWFIVIASNLTMGIAWHRFLAPFNIFFRRNADGKSSLGALPAMMSHGKEIDFEDPKEDDVWFHNSSNSTRDGFNPACPLKSLDSTRKIDPKRGISNTSRYTFVSCISSGDICTCCFASLKMIRACCRSPATAYTSAPASPATIP